MPQECPRGCAWMLRRERWTGETSMVETPTGFERIRITEPYLTCPVCGWVIDI